MNSGQVERINLYDDPADSPVPRICVRAGGVTLYSPLNTPGVQGSSSLIVRRNGVSLAAQYVAGISHTLVGSSLSTGIPSTVTFNGIAALSSTDVAICWSVSSTAYLARFTFNGSSWIQVGSTYPVLSSAAYGGITSLDEDTLAVAVCRLSGTADVFTLHWTGSTWSKVGNTLIISANNQLYLCRLNSNTIALMNTSAASLGTYSFDGTDWTHIGSSISTGGSTSSSQGICTHSPDGVTVVMSYNTTTLRAYRWNGSIWSLIGSLAATLSSSIPSILKVTPYGFDVVLNGSAGSSPVTVYRWDEGTLSFSQFGATGLASSDRMGCTRLLGQDYIYVMYSFASSWLRTYRFE